MKHAAHQTHTPTITLRAATEHDHAFIYATYLRNRWFSTENTTTLRKETWMKVQHQRLEQILASQPAYVAGLEGDDDVILAYAFQDGSEPWTYEKLSFRNRGLKQMLLEALNQGDQK